MTAQRKNRVTVFPKPIAVSDFMKQDKLVNPAIQRMLNVPKIRVSDIIWDNVRKKPKVVIGVNRAKGINISLTVVKKAGRAILALPRRLVRMIQQVVPADMSKQAINVSPVMNGM